MPIRQSGGGAGETAELPGGAGVTGTDPGAPAPPRQGKYFPHRQEFPLQTDGLTQVHDELGAHVSARGGVEQAPARARLIEARVLQLFTKQPSRWAEPTLTPERVEAFREARLRQDVVWCVSHDSYLINLASPDPALWRRSQQSFQAELERCAALGIEAIVTHPGNSIDGNLERAIAANARGLTESLGAVAGPRVLLELTAGSGSSIGATFESLAAIRDALPEAQRARVGVCLDTCHAYAAGYDLVGDYEGVWAAYEAALPLTTLELFHLNDSLHPLASRRDRHAGIGEGTLGPAPFEALMNDPRFRAVPKILETPKGDDEVTLDRRNLALLRAMRRIP